MDVQRKLRTPEAAEYLGLSQSTLAKMRLRGDGPAYLKAGQRIVLYAQYDEALTERINNANEDSKKTIEVPRIFKDAVRKM